jgi:hypothetical protein
MTENNRITLSEAAGLLGMHSNQLHKLCKRGFFETLDTAGYKYTLERREVEALLQSRADGCGRGVPYLSGRRVGICAGCDQSATRLTRFRGQSLCGDCLRKPSQPELTRAEDWQYYRCAAREGQGVG